MDRRDAGGMVQLLPSSEPTGNFNQNIIVSKFNQEFNTENMRRRTMDRRDAEGMVQLLPSSEPTGNFNQNIIVSKFDQEFNTENMRRRTMDRRDAGGMVQLLASSEPTGEHLNEETNNNSMTLKCVLFALEKARISFK